MKNNSIPTEVEDSIISLGKRLKIARLRRNLTVAHVAESLGIGTVTIHRLENGKKFGNVSTYFSLLWHYGLFKEIENLADTLQDDVGLLNLNKKRSRQPKTIKIEDQPSVYFIGTTDGLKVKIGKSKNVQERLNSIQICCPLRLEILAVIPYKTDDDAYAAEQNFHTEFKEYNISGEWFEISGRLKKFLKGPL